MALKTRLRPIPRRPFYRITRAALLASMVLLVGLAAVSIGDATAASATSKAHPAPATIQQSWTVVKSPAPTDALLLESTCVDAWDCWSVGGTIANGNDNNLYRGVAEHWNGSAWSSVPTLRPGNDGWIFTSVTCAEADDCWAVGGKLNQGSPPTPFAEHWNGSAWSIVGMKSTAGYLLGVSCENSSACWAVGPLADGSGNTDGSLFERWNGSSWTEVASPGTGQHYGDLSSVTCPSTSECFAVGWAGPDPQNTGFLPIFPAEIGGKAVIDRWNGSSWSSVAAPQNPGGTYLSGVSCAGPSECFAVGSLTNAAGNAKSALVDTWDGTSWSSSTVSGFENPTGDFLHQVTCLNASYCLAAGSSGLENRFSKGIEPAVAVWNGSEWSGTSVNGSFFVAMLEGIACAGRSQCFASGLIINPDNNNVAITSLTEQLTLPQGYRLAASDGGVFDFGSDTFHGSLGGIRLNAPVVAMSSPDADGYRLAASDGGVFSFGDATFSGSMAGRHLNAPVVGIASHDDWGYWVAGSDGGIFSFGDATYHGSMAGKKLAAPIVGIAATPDGNGYWLVGADGGVFSFGDAAYYGSTAGLHLAAPIVSMTVAQDGKGYWLVGADGGVFSFRDAAFLGSEAGKGIGLPVVAGS